MKIQISEMPYLLKEQKTRGADSVGEIVNEPELSSTSYSDVKWCQLEDSLEVI